MEREIKALKAQVQTLLTLSQQPAQPPCPPPPPAANLDLQTIIEATTRAVLKSIQDQKLVDESIDTLNLMNKLHSNDANADKEEHNMSCDSDASNK